MPQGPVHSHQSLARLSVARSVGNLPKMGLDLFCRRDGKESEARNAYKAYFLHFKLILFLSHLCFFHYGFQPVDPVPAPGHIWTRLRGCSYSRSLWAWREHLWGFRHDWASSSACLGTLSEPGPVLSGSLSQPRAQNAIPV